MARSAYVHIPFCASICPYCGFCRFVSDKTRIQQWLDVIVKEIAVKPMPILDTLYFGGGTPNVLDEASFTRLCAGFERVRNETTEFTVECNPDLLTPSFVNVLKQNGVNRISLGVQSFQDRHLQTLGRKHDAEKVIESVRLLQKAGLFNISVDLMYGYPGQNLDDLKADLDRFFSLQLPHLSIYSLQIEKNSIFGKEGIEPCEEDLEADMYETIVKSCKEHGYMHYEISSFAKEGHLSRHNLAYWSDRDFYGFGLGASGKENGILYENTKSFSAYMENGASPRFLETDRSDQAFDAIMMSLRTVFGLNIKRWEKKYQKPFFTIYRNVLEKYMPDCLFLQDGFLRPTEKGLEILNTILVEFLEVD